MGHSFEQPYLKNGHLHRPKSDQLPVQKLKKRLVEGRGIEDMKAGLSRGNHC